MTLAYRVALFLHIAALLGAIAASTLLHFFQHRIAASERAPEARRWTALSMRVSIVFPIALLTLVATGGYMVSQAWTWGAGWVDAWLVGAVLLLANGIRLGKQGRATLGALEQAGDRPLSGPTVAAKRAAMAAYANTGVATAVVFVMSLKLDLAGSLVTLAIGGLGGAFVGARSVRVARAVGDAPADSALDGEPGAEPA
ncbi:MAG: hypothetical protein ACREMU_06155 [Gemmatimonadaceae bacterium]